MSCETKICAKKNGKLEETTPKKIAMVWPRKLYPVGLEAITSKKTRNYKEKNEKVDLIAKNEKRNKQWGEEIRVPTSE